MVSFMKLTSCRSDIKPLMADSALLRSKLVSLFRSFRAYSVDSYYGSLRRTTHADVNVASLREIVQKALFSGYQREVDFESDVRKVVLCNLSIPLVEPKIGLDLTVPYGTSLLPIDPLEEINVDNWKERGALREYYAKVTETLVDSDL